MKHIRLFSAVALLAAGFCAAATVASAADAEFPPGVRVGMTPLVGLVRAKKFAGFETEDGTVKVLVAELPAEAYGEVANAFKTNPAGTNALKPESIETAAGLGYYTAEDAKDGPGNVRRYSMILPGVGFSGYIAVQVPENATKIYSDDAVRQMFASATIRTEVPVAEQVAMMPFDMNELGSFKNVHVLAGGAAIVLSDSDKMDNLESAPFMVIGLISSTPASPDDRGRFAQQNASAIPGIRDARMTMNEPVRIDGVAGFETRIDATSGKDSTSVSIVQWLRFGGGSSLRIIGSTPRDQWPDAFTRFRAVRDGIHPR